MKKSGRGGKRTPRPGKKIGRPPGTKKAEAEKKKNLNIRIRPDLAEWLASFPRGEKTGIVENALDLLRKTGV